VRMGNGFDLFGIVSDEGSLMLQESVLWFKE
jgi:hypothetical protein